MEHEAIKHKVCSQQSEIMFQWLNEWLNLFEEILEVVTYLQVFKHSYFHGVCQDSVFGQLLCATGLQEILISFQSGPERLTLQSVLCMHMSVEIGALCHCRRLPSQQGASFHWISVQKTFNWQQPSTVTCKVFLCSFLCYLLDIWVWMSSAK